VFGTMASMTASPHLLSFFVAALLLLAIPGPAVLYIATRSATQGRVAGFVSVLGIASGGMVHLLASIAGLSLIFARSAAAIEYVRFAGAIYLFYLGIRKLRDGAAPAEERLPRRQTLWAIYRDGVIVNVFNPKTALFFFSFLPQFVSAGGNVTGQLLFLGCAFVSLALITDSCWALAASSAASMLSHRASAYASGLIYMGLAVAAAVGGRRGLK